MTSDRTEKLADIIGWITLGFGTALTVAPRRSATALGLGDRPVLAPTIGITDLIIGTGLLRGRRRWPWMATRAAMNLALVGCYAAELHKTKSNSRARTGIIAMTALTIVDTTLTLALATKPPTSP